MPEAAIANRRAALLVHAMPAADREWLLAELDPAHRSVLAALLEELRGLEIPRDPTLLQQLLDEEAAGDPERSLAALPAAALPRLWDVLRGEHESVTATFLRAGAWPWRQAALQELGAPVREAFASAPAAAPGHLRQAIVDSVWQAVQALEPTNSTPRRARRWSNFLRRRGQS